MFQFILQTYFDISSSICEYKLFHLNNSATLINIFIPEQIKNGIYKILCCILCHVDFCPCRFKRIASC